MNENTKTLTFVITAVVIVALGLIVTREPSVEVTEVDEHLFPDFKDPLQASSLEVVRYDEEMGKASQFAVSQKGGVWTIPSHQGYPADARDQVVKAASSVIDLKSLGVESDEAGDHELYGVLEPNPERLKPGATGVGTLVTLREGDKNLARFIIGKEVQGRPELRYVRRAGENRVYRMAVNIEALSTKFQDWIETDLLKLNSLDLSGLELKDYSIETAGEVLSAGVQFKVPVFNAFVTVTVDENGKWLLSEMTEFEENEPKESKATLAEDEELDAQKLNDLKAALDDLRIVDVTRKPPGVSANLMVDHKRLNKETQASLNRHGFWPVEIPGGRVEILGSDGQVIARMKDGVEYDLRFGQIAGVTEDAKKPAGKGTADEDSDEDDSTSINRYVLVTARFNPDLIPKPKLEELPGEKKGPADKAASPEADSSKGDEAEAAPKDEAAEKETAPKAETVTQGPPKQPERPAGQSTTDKPAGEGTTQKAAEKTDEELEQEREAKEEQRRRVSKENRRKQDDYDKKVADGKKRVEELNARFADWYYVIPDNVYRKIHLGRTDIIRKKADAKKAGDTGAGALDQFEGGLPQLPVE